MINPSIPLQGTPPPRVDPLASFARILQIKQAQDQQQDSALRRQALQQQIGERQAVRDAVADTGGDLEAAIPAIMRVSPETGIELSKATTQQQAAHLDLLAKRFDAAGRLARSATPQNFSTIKAQIGSLVGEDLAAQLGETYDAARLDQAIRWGEDARAAAAREHDALTRTLNEERFHETTRATKTREQETYRHNREMERTAAVRANAAAQSARERGRRSASTGEGGLSATQKAGIERWLFEQLKDLEKEREAPVLDEYGRRTYGADGQPVRMTEQQYADKKLHIENFYRKQVGLPPLAASRADPLAGASNQPVPPDLVPPEGFGVNRREVDLELPSAAAPPASPAGTTTPAAGTAGEKVVTRAQIEKVVAARRARGITTSYAIEEKRAKAEGYVIR